jgi:hypothetical protein
MGLMGNLLVEGLEKKSFIEGTLRMQDWKQNSKTNTPRSTGSSMNLMDE